MNQVVGQVTGERQVGYGNLKITLYGNLWGIKNKRICGMEAAGFQNDRTSTPEVKNSPAIFASKKQLAQTKIADSKPMDN